MMFIVAVYWHGVPFLLMGENDTAKQAVKKTKQGKNGFHMVHVEVDGVSYDHGTTS